MPPKISAQGFELDFDDLYVRMWEIAVDDRGDDTRLYRPASHETLKWLIADLAGTPAESGKTLSANNTIREQVHRLLEDGGYAERISQQTFRLLRPPDHHGDQGTHELSSLDQVPTEDPADDGHVVEDVSVFEVTGDDEQLTLGELSWSPWRPLSEAAREATMQPGVYVARAGGQIVYVGMAGVRKGRGVRGRLTVYARGRGAVSGLGEAALDRALADESWLIERLARLRTSGPSRATDWAAAALSHQLLELSWTAADSAEQARTWELRVLNELADADLWNRQRP